MFQHCPFSELLDSKGDKPWKSDCLRLHIESEVPTMAFGDHRYLFRSVVISRISFLCCHFCCLQDPGQAGAASLAWSGQVGRVNLNILQRQVLGAGDLVFCDSASLNPAQPQGSFATGKLCLAWKYAGKKELKGKGRMEESQQRRPAGGGQDGKDVRGNRERKGKGSGRRGRSRKRNNGQQISSPTFLLEFFSFPWL